MARLLLVASAVGAAVANEIRLVTFDGAAGTSFKFQELNDPVMGGQSSGTWHVDAANKVGVFDGKVADVPSLKAPGFIKAAADGKFPDASAAINGDLVLTVRTSTPEYKGFRVTFVSGTMSPSYSCSGGGSIPFSRGCFKAKFSVSSSKDFQTIRIPFKEFSDKWSPATGEQTSTCAQDSDVCPTASKLAAIKRIEVWAEGALGNVHLEVKEISAQSTSVDTMSTSESFVAAAKSELTAMESVHLVSFDGAAGTTFKFQELNDPVMGGKSTGTWEVDTTKKVGVFDGVVATVPSLKAPGFIKSAADGKFPDASTAINGDLVLTVRTSTPEYKGFRVSLVSGAASPSYSCAGGGSLPFSRGCFKAKFSVPAGNEFTMIRIPFKSFSDKWSPATGEQTTTCAENADVCPTASKLAAIQRIEIWAEGALGHVHLEVKDISAQVSSLGKVNPGSFNTCKGPVQSNLRYNISSRTLATIPVPVGDGETLAEAVCCDSRTKVYAEPQFLFQAPDIDLFSKLKGVTTFYDPVCGLPLFRAPINRTMAEFKADTVEHGWPSFRSAEVISENVHTEDGGFVYSKCGTHLGSYLPDTKGPRWCMDLSCVSGNPVKDADDITVTI